MRFLDRVLHSQGTFQIYNDPKKVLAMHSIVVQSPYLKDFLKRVLAGYPGVTVGLDRLEFAGRFEPLIHRWKELNAALDELKTDVDTEGPVTEAAPVAEDSPAVNADSIAISPDTGKEHVNRESTREGAGNEKETEAVERYVTLSIMQQHFFFVGTVISGLCRADYM